MIYLSSISKNKLDLVHGTTLYIKYIEAKKKSITYIFKLLQSAVSAMASTPASRISLQSFSASSFIGSISFTIIFTLPVRANSFAMLFRCMYMYE